MSSIKYFVVLLLCSVAFAQDALVVELPKAEAATAKTLYNAKISADKAWDKFNDMLGNTYKGFSYGIQFSKDFRFIVPKASPLVTSNWNGCSYAVPATGIFTSPSLISPPQSDGTWIIK